MFTFEIVRGKLTREHPTLIPRACPGLTADLVLRANYLRLLAKFQFVSFGSNGARCRPK